MDGKPHGATNPNGRVRGCYLHGLFTADAFRAAYLAELGGVTALPDYSAGVDAALDALADHLETHLDVDAILGLAGEVRLS
jgi:adenosylcobyric acid synthase